MVKKESSQSKSSDATICSQTKKDSKEDKRAAALRANLRRRKSKIKNAKKDGVEKQKETTE
jgi:hypothetical protein